MVSRITFIQHLDCELKNSQLPVKCHIEALTKMNSYNWLLAYHHGALRHRRTVLKRTLSSCRAVIMSR
jgi:hypothetical protein